MRQETLRQRCMKRNSCTQNNYGDNRCKTIEKTPESELMSVEEYFALLRRRVNERYDSLQS